MKKYASETQIGPSHKRLVTAADVVAVANTPSLKRCLSIQGYMTAKRNARQFFQDLIHSLTKHKKKWTATERMQYNRVAKFLE